MDDEFRASWCQFVLPRVFNERRYAGPGRLTEIVQRVEGDAKLVIPEFQRGFMADTGHPQTAGIFCFLISL